MTEFSFIWFLGAVAIFLYGIRVSRVGLQLLGGDRLRAMITSLTENRFIGVAVGAFVTIILQSSSATVNMLVAFAGAGLITLFQAMGVLLGADIGTTFVVVLLSIRKFSEYAMIVLVVGVVLDLFGEKKRTRYISMICVGFGFIFFGLHLMVTHTEPLKDSPFFIQLIGFLSESKFYSFALAAAFTPFLSSAGTIGLTIAFAFSGLINFEMALPYVLGANIGTCFTSLASSFSGSRTGKQVAIAHLLFKSIGVAIFLPLLHPFANLVNDLGSHIPIIQGSVSGHIALAHILFNTILSILFLPFIKLGVHLIEKLVPPTKKDLENGFTLRYINPNDLTTPSLAFANAKREILRVADVVYDMFRDSIRCFEKSNPDFAVEIESRDDKVDFIDREIRLFLTKLSQENLTDEQAKLNLSLLSIMGCLEEIGDIIDQNILDMAGKKIHWGRQFSEEGWRDIQEYHEKILENFAWSISALASGDKELVHRVLRNTEHLSETHERLRMKHLSRLQAGLKESFETSSIHLDTLSAFSRVAILLGDLVKPLLEVKL